MNISVKEIAKFGMFGAIIYAQKAVLASLPNIHLSAVLIIALTVVYRAKALYPIYVYVLLEGLFGGFTTWWIPYLYVWTILWGAVMLLPKDLPNRKCGAVIYMIVCSLHGFLFGTLFAPAQAIMFGLNFEGMIAWIIAGLSFDVIHGISNFCLGILIIPLINLFRKLEKTVAVNL